MNKKSIIVSVIFIAIFSIAIGFWQWKRKEIKKQEQAKIQQEEVVKQLADENQKVSPPVSLETEQADDAVKNVSLNESTRNEEFKKELIEKYDVRAADIFSLTIDDENSGYVKGTFSYKVSGGGKVEIIFLAYQKSNSNWQIVFHGNSFTSLAKCDILQQYAFPDSFKKYSDCNISEFSGLQLGWKLVLGNPRQDCSRTVYDGEVTVRGWYEYDYVYVEKDWIFKVLPADVSKITTHPENSWYGKYKLADASQDLENKLKKANQQKPEKVTLRGLSFYCEGIARASLASGTEALKN